MRSRRMVALIWAASAHPLARVYPEQLAGWPVMETVESVGVLKTYRPLVFQTMSKSALIESAANAT